ncbi:MAG: HAMP domain-containing histidine kinase [Chloroflexota bacterium]|nr:HAMP domain-containing histidine kinase [Chloroflexota bacterium]
MYQDRSDRRALDRALLRVRLAAVALGATLLILSPRSDQTAAGAVLLAYGAIVLIQRSRAVRVLAMDTVGVAADILFAAGLSLLMPLSAGTWALYAFAIGTAALGFGAIGAAAATAASIVAYDLVIATRAEELRPADLWPVQILLGIGLLVAELLWSAVRGAESERRLRTFALAQRDLIAAEDEAALLDRLTDHAVRSFGALSASIEVGQANAIEIRHERGQRGKAAAPLMTSWLLDDRPMTRLRCTFADAAAAEAIGATISDLATDCAPLLVAIRDRSRLERRSATLGVVLDGVRMLERDLVPSAVLAEAVKVATAIAGPSALVRPADGLVVTGDLSRDEALALLRDIHPPALVRDESSVPIGIVVSAGPGLALVSARAAREPSADDLHALTVLGEIAARAAERMTERENLVDRAESLGRQVAELDQQLRAKDDAVASAVHELRTPLTSVQAYAQLTSRNLVAVQQQVKQLDRLIADLLRSPAASTMELQLAEVDLLHEAKQAGRRTVLVSARHVNVNANGRGPFVVSADRSRVEQVIENLLSNAIKFSPSDAEIEVELDRIEEQVVLSVSDAGPGIPAGDLQRIFERYYRGAGHRDDVVGNGIGLAVAREIVLAHGGRIWATSAGSGKGSTFFVALPIAQPAPAEPLESGDGRGSREQAPHQG